MPCSLNPLCTLLVEPTLNMQTPASVAMGFTPLLVEESGKDTDSLMHTYWFIHMHVTLRTRIHTYTRHGIERSRHFNLYPPTEK